jgi:ribonuclease Z
MYDESLVPLIQGCDVLYHEATFMQDKQADARAKYHSTAREAATIARKAGVKKLLIGHFSARYKDLSIMLEEAKAVFPETQLAEDGLRLEVG